MELNPGDFIGISATSLRGVALCSRCDYARILPARAVREYSPSIALPFTRGEGSHMEDDNGVIIKMKRAGHSLATIDRHCEARWSAVEVIRRYCAKRKRALATSYTKFAFYERDRRCIFDTVVFSFYITFQKYRSFFRKSRYISRDIPHVG